MKGWSTIGDPTCWQSPLVEQPHECPDQRIYDLFVREMLRVESKAKLLNRTRQEPAVEDSCILPNEEVVESYESIDSFFERQLPRWLLEKIEPSDLRIVNRQMTVRHV